MGKIPEKNLFKTSQNWMLLIQLNETSEIGQLVALFMGLEFGLFVRFSGAGDSIGYAFFATS